MYESIFLLILLTMVAGTLFYSFKDIGDVEVSSDSLELRKLASKMYTNLKGKELILSAGELNYQAYVEFSKLIEKHLEKKGTKFTIYCGPNISISDEHKDLIDANGKILDTINEEDLKKIHPIVTLMYKYPESLKLKLKNERIDEHFFYSIDDKVAWREEKHEPFEESISYFKTNATKTTFDKLKKLESEIESIDLDKNNIKEKGRFFTRDMFKKVA